MHRNERRHDHSNIPLDLLFLSQKPIIKTTSKRVISIYGDINGFSAWLRISEYSPKEFQKAILPFYNAFSIFKKHFVKINADGFLCVIEIPNGNVSRVAIDILKTSFTLVRAIKEIISHMNYPSPEGFRLRISTGKAFELLAYDQRRRNGKRIEYIGYCLNLAERMTRVNKGEPVVACARFKQLLSDEQAEKEKLVFDHLTLDTEITSGIFPEDAKALYSVCYRDDR